MNKTIRGNGIRSNPAGDLPQIDPTAFVDPSAQIIGKVHIGPRVYVACHAVIRADEPDKDGKIEPVVIEAETNIQDGVIIHSRAGKSVRIGPRASVAHGAIIHGPCTIGEGCFVALRAVLYSATLEDRVWVGIGSIIMRATVPSHTMIPAGSVIRTASDVRTFRVIDKKEEKYQADVFEAATGLREGYVALYGERISEKVAD